MSVTVRTISAAADAVVLADLLDEVWGTHGSERVVPPDLLVAIAHRGYVAIAEDDGRPLGGSVGFFADNCGDTLHSHVTGVRSAGSGVGRLLKAHQREWAAERGLRAITWTFDPLISRNAHVNLTALGARVVRYDVDLYGPIADERSRGDESDRLLVEWLVAQHVPPREAPLVVRTTPVPDDIESLRESDPEQARAWRLRVRAAFAEATTDGLVVDGFTRGDGYRWVRPSASRSMS